MFCFDTAPNFGLSFYSLHTSPNQSQAPRFHQGSRLVLVPTVSSLGPGKHSPQGLWTGHQGPPLAPPVLLAGPTLLVVFSSS